MRKLFNCRDRALNFIQYHVGKCSSFKFWLDPWIQNRPLLLQYDTHTVGLFESNCKSLISDFQHDGIWHLPSSNHLNVREIRTKIMEVSINSNDSITWDGFQSNQVSISTIWNSLRHKGGQPPWYNTVWNEFSINKCSFTLRTALKNRLLTRDRMLNFHMQTHSGCLFCNNLESVEHLFSTCPFSVLVRRACPVTISDDWS